MPIPCRLLAWTVVVSSGIGVLGCGEKTEPTTPVPPAAVSSGNQVFDQHCAKCHSVGTSAAGPGSKGKMGGAPSLAKVGADPAHTKDWLAEHVKTPKAHKPDSKMPAFEGKLTPDEITSVVDFMAGLK